MAERYRGIELVNAQATTVGELGGPKSLVVRLR
jgi:hypothetical protein